MKVRILGVGLVLASLSAGQQALADLNEEIVPIQNPEGKIERSCEYFPIYGDGQSRIVSWELCDVAKNQSFSLRGISDSGEQLARLTYFVTGSSASLTAELDGSHAEIFASAGQGVISIDSIVNKARTSSGVPGYSDAAQVSISAASCGNSFPDEVKIESDFSAPSSSQTHHDPLDALEEFYQNDSVEAAVHLVGEVVLKAAETDLFSHHSLPLGLNVSEERRAFSPALLIFSIMDDVSSSQSQSKDFASCVLLALGATGAIIGAISDNPSLGVTCAGSCGAAMSCLGTLIGGTLIGAPCGAAIGTCLGCVGSGYTRNFSGCFRQFLEMR